MKEQFSLRLAVFLPIFMLFFAFMQAQTTRFVMPAASGTGDGSDWANASADLQAMIDASAADDAVWVAAGTYKPTADPFGNTSPADPRDKTFYLKNGVKVYGGFVGTESNLTDRDWVANATILSGDFNGDDVVTGSGSTLSITDNGEDAYHVVLSVLDDNTTVLDGFTIKGGNANALGSIQVEGKYMGRPRGGGMSISTGSTSVANCAFTENASQYDGGGLYIYDLSESAISNCTFTKNKSLAEGGAVSNDDGGVSPTFTDCSFTGNFAAGAGGGAVYNYSEAFPVLTNCTFTGNETNGSGGAIYNPDYGSSSTLINCTFSANHAVGEGGAFYAIENNPGETTVTGCVFENNTADDSGGAAYTGGTSDGTVFTDCVFTANSAPNGNGGGVYGYYPPTLVNCVFRDNHANYGGGTYFYDNGSATNCLFTGNTATLDGGGFLNDGYESTVTNCTFYGNSSVSGIGGGLWMQGTTNLTNCIFWGNTSPGVLVRRQAFNQSGDFNISHCDIQDGLPEGGTDLGGNIYTDPLFVNTTTDFSLQITSPAVNTGDNAAIPGGITLDLAGNARIYNAGTVDMGAYELQSACIAIRYVTSTGTGDGSSWANASSDLQAMMATGGCLEEVWVAAGTYKPTTGTDPNISFVVPSGLKLYGGFAGTEGDISERDIAANPTILSGEIGAAGDLTDNSTHVVSVNGAAAGTRLDGLTISDGYNNYTTAGGLNIVGASTVDIAYCTFTNNTGYIGGGIALADNSTANISRCTFVGNHAFHDGAGVYADNSTVQASNSIFRSGLSGDSGGGYAGHFNGTATFTNCLFYANEANYFNGSAVYTDNGTAANLVNCTVAGNIINSVLKSAVYLAAPGSITNSILWGQLNSIGWYSGVTVTVNNSITHTNTVLPGTGNSNNDPKYLNPSDPDGADDIFGTADDGYNVTSCSPAIDAADANAAPPLDLAGQSRVDVAGMGSASIVDMGVYEQQDPTNPMAVTSVVVSNVSDCTGGGTTCTSDDFYTLDLTVTFSGIPATGTLEISSAAFPATISVPVGDLSGSSYQVTGLQLAATTPGTISVEAHFSENPDCNATDANQTAPASCSGEAYYAPIEVSGFTGDCEGANGTYYFIGFPFGPGPVFVKLDFSFFLLFFGPGWAITDPTFNFLPSINMGSGPGMVPCTGWADLTETGCGTPTLSGGCDSGPLSANSEISEISITNIGTCNNNGTGDGSDDYFTADVTVDFAYAPVDMNLNVYCNGNYVTSVSSNDLLCVTTYTFTGVSMPADGSDLVFTADFDGNNSFTSPSLGAAPSSCPYPEISSVQVSNASACEANSTTCYTDDTYTADVTVYYTMLPATGSIELSSPDLVGAAPSVAVGDAGATEHTFTGVTFRADGASIQISAAFTGETPFENANAGTAPNCAPTYSNIFISGFQGECFATLQGPPYTPAAPQNGAPSWFFPYYTNASISWSGVRWELRKTSGSILVAHVDGGTPDNLPCSGWVQDFTDNDCGTAAPTLSGGCGVLASLPTSISDIVLANQSGCNDNGTSDAADDYFTADATVTFAFAPGSGDLTLKRGSTVLATKSSADLACATEWTFTGVQMAADGADIILTAEFSPAATFTSGSLGTAPVSCSCTPVAWYADTDNDTYGDAASSVMACDQPSGYVANSTDCNDANAAVHPGATETCNGTDDDCDGLTDTADPNYTDNVNPTITCPANLSVTANSGCSATGVNLGTPVTADNCGVASVTNNAPAIFPAGATTVTWTVTDGKGNSATCAQTVTVTGGCCGTGADLIVQSASAPLIANKAEQIYVDGVIKNIGTAQPNKKTFVRWYLSHDNVLDAADYTHTSWKQEIQKLQPNETEAFDKTVDLPNNNDYCGAKYLIFKADGDDEVTEACEINNFFVQPITISCTSAYKPDLVVQDATAPATISAGVNFSVTYKVRNIGGKKAVSTDAKYYLSANATYEAGDVLIDAQDTHILEPNLYDADNKNIQVANNTAPGAYYLLFVADANNVINPEEPSTGGETNNVFALPVTVTNCNADLRVQNESAPNNATAGATITVSAKVKNHGSYTAGASKLKYYLSDDNTFGNGDDVYLGFSATPVLAPDAISATLSASVTIPAGTPNGNYRIYFVADADGEVCETNENNNEVFKGISISGSAMPPPPSNDRDDVVVEKAAELNALNLTIFPNPASKEVTFDLQGFEGKAVELTMFDLLGRAVWQQTLEEGQRQVRLDLPATLPGSGLYLVRASSGNEAVTKQLVVLE